MRKMVEAGVRARIEELIARYGRALDGDALETWPDFFTEDGQYQVTTRDNHLKGRPIGLMYCDGRGMMRDRIVALRQAIVFEPHVYCHIVGGLLVADNGDDSWSVESSFHILRTAADGTTITYGSGCYLDEILQQGDEMQFRKRTVVLDSSRIDTLLVIPL